MKVLLLNAGYCSGLDGSYKDYILHGSRYLRTPRSIIEAVETSINSLIQDEQPDICCFLELNKHSALIQDLRDYPCYDVDTKYGTQSILRHLPFFRHNCNGFFAREEVPYKKYYFKNGAKKLIYELDIGQDISLLMCHFSLAGAVRQEQFNELKSIIKNRERSILCGDFNIFRGTQEIDELINECNLHPVTAYAPTFPAVSPSKAFDLFLCTNNLHITRCEVVRDFKGSDHLPVILEFKM